MKKIAICLIILIFVLIPFSTISALAEETEECYIVGSTETKVYLSDGFEPYEAFSIPKGYGFTVIEKVNAKYVKIRYSGGVFFLEETLLASCTKADASSIKTPSLIVELSPKILCGKPNLTESGDYLGTVMFLGEYKGEGQTTCYAVYKVDDPSRTVFYASPNVITNLSAIQELLNPSQIKPGNDQKPTPTTPVTDSNDQTPQNKTILRIILVLGIVIPAFIIILIVFKPGRKKQKVEREVDEGTDAFDNY